MADYFPNRQGDLDAWEVNFLEHIDNIAAELGIPADEVTPVKDMINAHRGAYNNVVIVRSSLPTVTEANVLQWEKTQEVVRKFVKRLKSTVNYTTVAGKRLIVEASDVQSIAKLIVKPVLTIVIQGGRLLIKFKKDGFDAVKIFSRRAAEVEFTLLDIDTRSPYTDTRPNLVPGQPEKREYIAYYMLNDEIVGVASDIISVII